MTDVIVQGEGVPAAAAPAEPETNEHDVAIAETEAKTVEAVTETQAEATVAAVAIEAEAAVAIAQSAERDAQCRDEVLLRLTALETSLAQTEELLMELSQKLTPPSSEQETNPASEATVVAAVDPEPQPQPQSGEGESQDRKTPKRRRWI